MAPPRVPLSELIVLGTGELMPALVYGFESAASGAISDAASLPALEFAPPSWLISVFVQAGGYAMSYCTVTGAVFRLADNARHAHRDLADCLRAFHLMAEDPDLRALKAAYPELLPLCATWGNAYTDTQLNALAKWLGKYFDLPLPGGGLEAFVRLAGKPRDGMLGWTHLHVKDPPRSIEGMAAAQALAARAPFDREDRDLLFRVGAAAFPDAGRPKLFLVWENSD